MLTPNVSKPSLPAEAIVALGISSSYLLFLAAPLVNPAHTAIYHWSGPASHLFAPVALDLLGMALILLVLLRSAAKESHWRSILWGAIILFTPSIELKNLAYIEDVVPWHWLSVALGVLAVVGWLVLIFSWRTRLRWRLEPVIDAVQTLFFFIGLGGILLLCEIGWFSWQARPINQPPVLAQALASSTLQAKRPRVIWIVFDELSFQQVYGDRVADLRLPAFDALAAESTVFTNAIPAGDHTEYVMPALLSGKPFTAVTSTSRGDLLVKSQDQAHFTRFDPNDTVFADARNNGYQSAVIGWYIPYCRMLPSLLTSCFWNDNERIQTGMYPDASILSNTLQPLIYNAGIGMPQRLLSRLFPVSTINALDARQHIQDYQEIDRAAATALEDPSSNFVLVHLPVPHPGSIFGRDAGKVSDGPHTYIDNLALTDQCLASMRRLLERSGQWDDSTIVIMGDHSWRTWIWRGLSGWTTEEERASHGGRFEPRPLYVVKLAGQRSGISVDTPYHALNTRFMIDQIFSHQIQTPQELAAWAQRAQ